MWSTRKEARVSLETTKPMSPEAIPGECATTIEGLLESAKLAKTKEVTVISLIAFGTPRGTEILKIRVFGDRVSRERASVPEPS